MAPIRGRPRFLTSQTTLNVVCPEECTIEMYHIVGGPRLPCLNSEGDIEIRSSELQIMSHEDCKIDNALALINGAAPICTLN